MINNEKHIEKNMKKIILVVTFFCIATIVAYAQTYLPSSKTDGGAMQSQQIMPARNYNGTVYEPFSSVTPSEQSSVGSSYSPSDTPGGPRKGKITGPDTPPADESPIGEPWVLAAFALLFAGTVALRRRKTTTTIEINHNTTNLNNNIPMKNNIVNKTSLTLLLLISLGVGQMGAAVTLYYQKDMPSGNYSASNSASMTQSSVNSNRYSCSVSLQNGSYGFYIKNGSDYYKVSATASTNSDVLLYNYGSTNYGNSNHRVTYNTGAAGYFIFTFDASNNKVNVSPRDGLTVKVAWDVASGHDGNYNLDNYTTLTEEGSTGKYSADIDLTAVKHYMFVQTDNSRYWKAASTLSINGSVSLYDYGTSNYGNSADKVNFTPSAAAKYRFTWDHADKTIKIQRLYNISYQKGSYGTGSTQTDYKVHGTNITLRSSGDFTRTGYNHTAWNTNANGSSGTSYSLGATYSTNSDLTLYPTWTAKTTTVNFDQQSGSGGSSSVTATYDAAMPSATMPTRSGYTFGGYFTAVGGGGTKYYNADGSSAKTCDLTSTTTLYAKWTQTITLDEQGATTSGTTSKSVTYNSNAGMSTMITAPSKTGYDYGGYYTDVAGSGYQIINNRTWQASVSGYTDASKNWIHSGATTIYAKWTQTVTLNANTDNHGSGANKSATATWNGTALSGFTATAAATGYNLIGYYSNATSGTKVLNADGTYAATDVSSYITSGKWTKAGATTLYAHMQAKTYSVTLDKNGGDSGGSTTATYNSNTLAEFYGASREGYSCYGYFAETSG